MVRALTAGDLDRVMQLWLQTNLEAHDFIDQSYWRENADGVRQAMAEAEVLVYEEAGRVEGFVGLLGETLAGIFVERESQSKGVGKALLDEAKSRRDRLTLGVYQKNTRARAFYEREGFLLLKQQVDENTGETELILGWEK